MRIERSRVARRSVRRCWCLHSADKDNRRSGSRALAGRRAASRAVLNRESFATRDGTARLATGNRIGRARCRRSPRPRRHRPADERDRANRPSRRRVCRRKQGPCQRRRQVAVRAYATTKFGLSSASAAPGRAAIRCSAPRVRCSPRRRAAVRSRVPQRRRGKAKRGQRYSSAGSSGSTSAPSQFSLGSLALGSLTFESSSQAASPCWCA